MSCATGPTLGWLPSGRGSTSHHATAAGSPPETAMNVSSRASSMLIEARAASGWSERVMRTRGSVQSGVAITVDSSTLRGAGAKTASALPATSSTCGSKNPTLRISRRRSGICCTALMMTRVVSGPAPAATTPIRSTGDGAECRAAIQSRTSWWASSARRACGSSSSPAVVRLTAREVRSNSGSPTVASSREICWLSDGGAMLSRAAAAAKCSSSASTAK